MYFPSPRFCLLFCCPWGCLLSELPVLGAQSLFANFLCSRSLCGLYSFADSFIKKMPVPGFSTRMTSHNLLE